MKLATFRHEAKTSVGLVFDGRILDLSATQPDLTRDMIGLLSSGESALQAAALAPCASARPCALGVVGFLAVVKRPPERSAIGFNVVVHREIEGLGRTEDTVQPGSPRRSLS